MPKHVLMLVSAIILATIGSGCSQTEVRYLAEPLPIPVRPMLPVLVAGEVMCLSDDAYRKLVERNRLRREYTEELEAIIHSTHEKD